MTLEYEIIGFGLCSSFFLEQLGVAEYLAAVPAAQQSERRRQEAQRADEEVEAEQRQRQPD